MTEVGAHSQQRDWSSKTMGEHAMLPDLAISVALVLVGSYLAIFGHAVKGR